LGFRVLCSVFRVPGLGFRVHRSQRSQLRRDEAAERVLGKVKRREVCQVPEGARDDACRGFGVRVWGVGHENNHVLVWELGVSGSGIGG